MAQHVQTILIDDISGKEIPVGEGESIQFTYDGVVYQLDLDSKNAAKFHSVLEGYVSHAQKLGRAGNVTVMRQGKKNADLDLAAVRSWAESNGYEISTRGRVKGEIIEAFRAAMA